MSTPPLIPAALADPIALAASLQAQADEERAYTLSLGEVEELSARLTQPQRTALVHAVACLLPSSERAVQPISPSAASPAELANESWEARFLRLLVSLLGLDASLVHTLAPLVGASFDPSPFVQALLDDPGGSGGHAPTPPIPSLRFKMRVLLLLLHLSLVAVGGYDSRVRVVLRSLCGAFGVRWAFFASCENRYAELVAQQLVAREQAQSRGAKAKRWAKVGLVGAGAGALLFVTGGLAAPALGAGLASLGFAATASSAAFLVSASGVALMATVFGGVGAGLVGYRLNRRISRLAEFRFERLTSKDHAAMSVALTVSGFLTHESDYHSTWACMLPQHIVCSSLDATEATPLNDEESAEPSITAGQLLRQEEQEKAVAVDGGANDTVAAPTATITTPADDSDPTPPIEPQPPRSSDDSYEAARAAFEVKMLEHRYRLVDDGVLPAAVLSTSSSTAPLVGLAESSEVYTLRWESEWLLRFGLGLDHLASGRELAGPAATATLKQTALAGVVSAIAWPVALLQAGELIDNPWLVLLARCDQAALELADALEQRVAGARPVSLIATSMGARVVFLALEELHRRDKARRKAQATKAAKELVDKLAAEEAQAAIDEAEAAEAEAAANQAAAEGKKVKKPGLMDRMRTYRRKRSAASAASKASAAAASAASTPTNVPKKALAPGELDLDLDAHGVVMDVYLFGAPVPCSLVRWTRARRMIAGRFVNGYCARDWLLRFAYPLTNLSRRVAGLMPLRQVQKKLATAPLAIKQAETSESMEDHSTVTDGAPSELAIESIEMLPLESLGLELDPLVVVACPLAEAPSSSVAVAPSAASSSSSSSSSTSAAAATAATAIATRAAITVDHTPEPDSEDEQDLATDENEFAAEEVSHAADLTDPEAWRAGVSAAAPELAELPARYAPVGSTSTASSSGSCATTSVVPLAPSSTYNGIESINLTALVHGHRDYPYRLELLLQACGYQP